MLQLASAVWDCSHDCAIESTGHHEEACSLQPIGFWMKWKCFHEIMTGMGNVGLLKQHSVLITQFFISLKSRWTELFEDPLEPHVYLYQTKIHSELGSHCNSYVYKNAKRPRQYSKISKAAVQVVDMAATINMVLPNRASTCSNHRYPCTLFISIKAQMTTMLMQFWTSTLNILDTTAAWVGCGYSTWPHGYGSTPVLRNDCEAYLQMCRIKWALLISRYTAGQDWHGWTITSSAPSLRWCSPTSYSMCHHSNSATMKVHISYFIYM